MMDSVHENLFNSSMKAGEDWFKAPTNDWMKGPKYNPNKLSKKDMQELFDLDAQGISMVARAHTLSKQPLVSQQFQQASKLAAQSAIKQQDGHLQLPNNNMPFRPTLHNSDSYVDLNTREPQIPSQAFDLDTQ